VPELYREFRRQTPDYSPMPQTELSSTTAQRTTALAAALGWAEPSVELAGYRGVLTALQLDAPEKETAALVKGAAVHDLGWMRRVAVRGEDRFRWLSGMVTNTVNDLSANAGAWNLVLNAQGRIQGDLWVWRDGDAIELNIAADQAEKLLAHLDHFIIMDDVELVPIEEQSAIGLTGPQAGEILTRLGLRALDEPLTQASISWEGFDLRLRRSYGPIADHYEISAPEASLALLWNALINAGAAPAGCASHETLRIAEGIPAYGIDIAERDLPQETAQMRALHFNKGCYLGQEIVERIRSRGNVHRHLRPLELSGPVPAAGTEFAIAGEAGKAAGHISSAAELRLPSGARIFGLGMIRAEAEVGEAVFAYTAGGQTGEARILSAAPQLHF
jgi:folate-binding protein YgfZ